MTKKIENGKTTVDQDDGVFVPKVVKHRKKKEPVFGPDECLKGTDGQLMVTAAHRYCLGRRSYIVGAALDWLHKWWGSFERNTQRVILRDTIQAIQENMAGDGIDVRGWTQFAADKFELLVEEDKQWVRSAVRQDKIWPLNRADS